MKWYVILGSISDTQEVYPDPDSEIVLALIEAIEDAFLIGVLQ